MDKTPNPQAPFLSYFKTISKQKLDEKASQYLSQVLLHLLHLIIQICYKTSLQSGSYQITSSTIKNSFKSYHDLYHLTKSSSLFPESTFYN